MTPEEVREIQVNEAAALYVFLHNAEVIPGDVLISAVAIAHNLDAEQVLRLEERVRPRN